MTGSMPRPGTFRAFIARSALAALLFALLFGLLTYAQVGAQSQPQAGTPYQPGDWPTYGHDPGRTGYNPDEHTLAPSNAGQLVQLWQSPDLGMGPMATSSAPVVANGTVFVGSSASTGDNYFAFDATTGGKLWSANLGHANSCTDVGIGSTAAVSGTLLVVGGGDDAYYGLDTRTGQVVWRNPMNVGPSGFAWASPLIAGGRVYFGMSSSCDNPPVRGELRAVYLDGSPAGTQFFVPEGQAGAGIWNSPTLSPDATTLLLATGEDYGNYDGPYNRAMVSLDPATLAILQAHKEGGTASDQDFGTSPVVFRDSQGRLLVGADHKNGTFYTYALSGIQDGPIWSRPMGVRIGMLPAYDPTFEGGTLFVQGASARFFAVDPATGNNRWPDVEANGRGNMAIANGLIFLNDQGTLRILDERDGHLLRAITPNTAGPSNSGVAVAHGVVYWLSGSRLNAWGLPAGARPTPVPTAAPTLTLPGTGSATFPQTGFTVSGIFLSYWQTHGGLIQQGYPISALMQEVSDLDGKTYTVQYFERAVFEYHPENQPPYNVLLSHLGRFQYEARYPHAAPGQQPNTSAGSVLFPQTGHRVGGKFLQYWQTHGGLAQQGYPISDEFTEVSPLDGKTYTVQYFERAVFEYHPENQPPYDVLLSQLGTFRHKLKHPAGLSR